MSVRKTVERDPKYIPILPQRHPQINSSNSSNSSRNRQNINTEFLSDKTTMSLKRTSQNTELDSNECKRSRSSSKTSINNTTFTSELEDFYTCCVCFQSLCEEIISCENGHLYCNYCRTQLKNSNKNNCVICKSCTFQRNGALERLAHSALRNQEIFVCPYDDCGIKLNKKEIKDHIMICEKKPWECIYNCKDTFLTSEQYLEHINMNRSTYVITIFTKDDDNSPYRNYLDETFSNQLCLRTNNLQPVETLVCYFKNLNMFMHILIRGYRVGCVLQFVKKSDIDLNIKNTIHIQIKSNEINQRNNFNKSTIESFDCCINPQLVFNSSELKLVSFFEYDMISSILQNSDEYIISVELKRDPVLPDQEELDNNDI